MHCICVVQWLAVCSCVTFELLDQQSQLSQQQQQQHNSPVVRIMIDHEPLQTALLPITAEGDVLLSGMMAYRAHRNTTQHSLQFNTAL
jgi:hypothetical protein